MDSDLRNMVMAFRVTELQTLLNYAGKNRSGRKNELQQRALDLIKGKSGQIVMKVRELYRTIQMQTMSQPQPASAGIPNPHSTFSTTSGPNNRVYTVSSGFTGATDKVLQGRSPFSAYNGAQPKIPGLSSLVPVCPNVKLKKLPFYDILHDVIKPTNLVPHGSSRTQESTFTFNLSASQAGEVSASKEYVKSTNGNDQKIQYTVQLQLRFCLSDSSSDQEDCFPPSMTVKLNGKIIPLPHPIPSNRPGVEPKRPSRPLNVTNYAKLSTFATNTITVIWSTDGSKTYTISVYLVRKLCSKDLLERLKNKGVRPVEYTKGMIKEIVLKDEADCQIATTSFKVSIACPLGKCRMTLPCRASTCSHLQCFDADLYLQMNEKKPSWNCPVCDKATLFDDLNIDGYFQDVLVKMENIPPSEGNDIEILPDGAWAPIKMKKNEDGSPPAKRIRKATKLDQTICIDDDLIIEEDVPPSSKRKNETITIDTVDSDSDSQGEEINKSNSSNGASASKNKQKNAVECITIDDSEEEDVAPDPAPEPEPDEQSSPSPPPGPTRTLRPRGGRTTYVDETSSSSSTTNDESIKQDPVSDHLPASPACITLSSPSPSPELRRESPTEGPSNTTGPNFSNYSFSDSGHGSISGNGNNFSSSSAAYNTRQAAHAANAPAGSTANYSTLSNDSSSLLSSSTYSAQPSQGYVHYGSSWNPPPSQGSYQGGTFGPLDYTSLDYFNQPYNSHSGASGGYNWPP